MEYDALGNITYNSRVGAYTYGSSQPRRVTAAGSNTFGYDANGNMTSNTELRSR
ncbi:MAG: hypothetical protein ABFD97_09635 [Syntrophobacter sp.]